MKIWMAIAVFVHLIFGLESFSIIGCRDLLPPVMKKSAHCKKLKLSCLKLKNKCSDALSVAIGISENAKKCKKALDELGKENVDVFCANTCETCGCKDDIPTSCTIKQPLNTCSKIISFGKSLGITQECYCNIEWKKFIRNKFFPTSCDSTTPIKIKDTCKLSCNTCSTSGPVNCVWSPWSEWSSCTATCGRRTKTQQRSKLIEASNGGLNCFGNTENTIDCKEIDCPDQCQDEIPSSCAIKPPLSTCSKIISFGENLGIPQECYCNIEWVKFIKHQFSPTVCDSNTTGQIKDTCKLSCNACSAPGTPSTKNPMSTEPSIYVTPTIAPECKDLKPLEYCQKVLKKKCKNRKEKRNCEKTCNSCPDIKVVSPDCVIAHVGSSSRRTKSIDLDVPDAERFHCPMTVDKSIWLGNDRTFDGTFDVTHKDDHITVKRTDIPFGWPLDLKFECCLGVPKNNDLLNCLQNQCCCTRSGRGLLTVCGLRFPECYNHRCQNNGVCYYNMADESAKCRCPKGYKGESCEINEDTCKSDTCNNHGACTAGPDNSFTCTCDSGYDGTDCSNDIDHCAEKPCAHGICIDLVTSSRCECYLGWGGEQCNIDEDNCFSDGLANCKHQGQCIDGNNTYTCLCKQGYHYHNCREAISCDENDSGRECEFPFTYNNVQYRECTVEDANKPWCYDNGFWFLSSSYGYCTKCYKVVTERGICKHYNGNSLPKCKSRSGKTEEECQTACTSNDWCLGYLHADIADNANCKLLPRLSGFNSCPNGYTKEEDSDHEYTDSSNSWIEESADHWQCLAKHSGMVEKHIVYKLGAPGESCTDACANGCNQDSFVDFLHESTSIVTDYIIYDKVDTAIECSPIFNSAHETAPYMRDVGDVKRCVRPTTVSTCDAFTSGRRRICPCNYEAPACGKQETVGTCADQLNSWKPCSASRGPTECIDGKCICKLDFYTADGETCIDCPDRSGLVDHYSSHFVGDGRESDCSESNGEDVSDSFECRRAAKQLIINFAFVEYNADNPKGCYKFSNNRIYWNDHPTGMGHSSSSPICRITVIVKDDDEVQTDRRSLI